MTEPPLLVVSFLQLVLAAYEAYFASPGQDWDGALQEAVEGRVSFSKEPTNEMYIDSKSSCDLDFTKQRNLENS